MAALFLVSVSFLAWLFPRDFPDLCEFKSDMVSRLSQRLGVSAWLTETSSCDQIAHWVTDQIPTPIIIGFDLRSFVLPNSPDSSLTIRR